MPSLEREKGKIDMNHTKKKEETEKQLSEYVKNHV